ncbi:hypothetical protein XCY_002270 [Xanthomonas arboricola pv. juglandis]|nr:hypothetical protein X12_002271 [Xanthomonas arboricola]CAG2090697.1 hypothetical protein XCY_002270 [Xanthomonas arboricola pv. juglandis]
MVNAIAALLDEKIDEFRRSFLVSSRQLYFGPDGKPLHNGEFGGHREVTARTLVSQFTPERMAVDSGFVVNSRGKVSTQCDIVVYDTGSTPLIRNANYQRFFPIESVCAVGEVKSILKLSEAKDALIKLAKTKALRDTIHEPSYVYRARASPGTPRYRPEHDELDQLVSFVICEKLDFDVASKLGELVGCYNSAAPRRPFCHQHNLLLSVEDGLLAYLHGSGVLYPFPSVLTLRSSPDNPDEILEGAKLLGHRWVQPNPKSIEHIRHFCALLHTALASISVLFPNLGEYVSAKEDVRFIDIPQRPVGS